MYTGKQIHILLPGEKELSSSEIADIAALVNAVYLDSESDFWPQNGNYQRTTTHEIASFLAKKELLLAILGNTIVGVAHIYPIHNAMCGFGMLVTAPQHRKKGMGTAMIAAIENWAKDQKYQTIQLELLRPDTYPHPEKEFLKKWYLSLGFQWIGSTSYAELYPDQAHLLKIPCTFDIYQKNLKK